HAITFIKTLIIYNVGKIFECCAVISDQLVQCSQGKQMQRRRIRHSVEYHLAVFDHFGHFKTIPATIFVSQNGVSSQIKIEDLFNLAILGTTREQENDETPPRDKHHHYRRNARPVKQRDNHHHRNRFLCESFIG